MTCSLKDLPEKTLARVVDFTGATSSIQRLMGRGLRQNTLVQLIRKLFFGSNYVIEVNNEQLVLSKHEAQCLKVTTSS